MKRLNKKRRARLIRLMHYRRRYAARIRRQRREDKLRYARSGGISRIPAPVLFSLEGSGPRLLLDFIRRVRQAAECGHFGLIEIDFRSTEKMVADGTLYFLANLEMLKKQYPRLSFGMRRPSDAIVMQVLYQVGIAALLGRGRGNDRNSFHKNVRHWHAASGCKVNAKDAANVFGSFEGKITPELSRSVYTGITEAMTNCHHHAYEGTNIEEGSQKWWLFSREWSEAGKSELQVLFCDLGIGIPASLYRESDQVDAGWYTRLTDWFKTRLPNGRKPNDALKIKAAVEIGQTRTKLKNRGKGLKQMVGFLDQLGDNQSRVTIFSGAGVYRRAPKNGKPTEYTHALCTGKSTPICGTLINWSIPLPLKGLDI